MAGTDATKLDELLDGLRAADAPLLALVEAMVGQSMQYHDSTRGLLPAEKLAIYATNPERQLVLHFDAAEYAYVLRALDWLRAHFGVTTNAAAIQRLLQAEVSRLGGPAWERGAPAGEAADG